LVKLGRPREALPSLTEALRLRKEAADADPKDWRASSLLASARFQYGRALAAAGQWQSGMEQLHTALREREILAQRNPNNTGARGEVAEAAAAVADAMAGRGRWRDAVPFYEQALTTYTDLRNRGSLTAELGDEPARIEAALLAARR
jgi:tetratricopeptide (TPR) repeat protein